MFDFLRRTFFVDRRKERATVLVERRRRMTVSTASIKLDDAIDRFSNRMNRIKERVQTP